MIGCLLGDDLFVVPVQDETGTVSIEFPEGEWVFAFDSGEVYEGGESTTMTVSMAQYPLFYRQGSDVGAVVTDSLADLR